MKGETESHDMGKHMWIMMLACIVPLVIILLLPVFGIKGNFTWIAIIAMFAMHLLMMGGHGNHASQHKHPDQVKSAKKDKGEKHENT